MSEKTAFEKHSSHFPKCNVQCPSKFAPMLTDVALGLFGRIQNANMAAPMGL